MHASAPVGGHVSVAEATAEGGGAAGGGGAGAGEADSPALDATLVQLTGVIEKVRCSPSAPLVPS